MYRCADWDEKTQLEGFTQKAVMMPVATAALSDSAPPPALAVWQFDDWRTLRIGADAFAFIADNQNTRRG